jgi:hypothetical protein
MKVKKAFLALTLLIAAGVGASQLFANSTRSTASNITVDQGSQQCSGVSGTYKHADAINLAVAAAASGATIKVCPGKYDPVVVPAGKDLTIQGTSVTATSSSQCIAPSTNPATDQTKYAIVDGNGTTAAISVDDVTNQVVLQNLTIQNGPSGVHTTAGTQSLAIKANVIQNNSIGVYLNGGGPDSAKNKVQKNCIRRNNLAGSASGNGIYSEADLDSAKIENNTFFRNNNAGDGGAVNLADGTITDVQILTNTSSQDANFVSAHGSSRLIISGNTVTGALGGAVWLDGDNDDAQVTKNSFTNGHDDGIGLGGSSDSNDHVLIFGNTITGNATDGIDTSENAALTGSEIGNNTVKTNGDRGIALVNNNNANNFVTGNTVSGNGVDANDNCVDTDKVTYNNTWFSNGTDCTP